MSSFLSSPDNQNPFIAGSSKGRQLKIDPNEELICNNCINSELVKAKRDLNQQGKAAETPLDAQDRLNQLTQNNIKSKVQQRIELSEKAARQLGRHRSVDKERLIKENEKGVFFLNDPNQLSNDFNKDKAMKRYNQNQLHLSSSMKQMEMKPGVEEYYQKCVDNYISPKDKPMKSKRYIQQNYNESLDNQILENQRLKGRSNRNADSKANEEAQDEDKKYRNQQNEEFNRQKKLKEDFLIGNRSLISMRNAKNKRDKKTEDDMERTTSFLHRQLDEEDRHKKEKEEFKKQMFQKDLNNQIKQKQKEKAKEKENDYPSKANATSGSCTCQGMGICSNCKKSYPLSFLNPKRNYSNLYQRRKSYKQSQ